MTPSERKEYWRKLLEHMNDRGLMLKPRQPYTETWQIIDDWPQYSIRSAARLNADKHWIHVDITLLGPNREEYFDRLKTEGGKIQDELRLAIPPNEHSGVKLRWEKEAPNHPKECWIYLPVPEDPSDRRRRDSQHEWLANVLIAFREAFGARIKRW